MHNYQQALVAYIEATAYLNGLIDAKRMAGGNSLRIEMAIRRAESAKMDCFEELEYRRKEALNTTVLV